MVIALHARLRGSPCEVLATAMRLRIDSAWTELAPWPEGTALALPGPGVEIGWDEVYGGVGLG